MIPTSSTYDQFQALGTNSDLIPSQSSNTGFKAGVYSNADYSQIVIAFRGTVLTVSLAMIKNIVTDVTFVNNVPNLQFRTSISDAAELVQRVHYTYPKAKIVLTGHSLGGGIGELVGAASGFPTVTFSAPGASALYSQLQNELKPALGLATSNAIVNYRLAGDQISLVDRQIGTQITLPAPDDASFSATSIGGVVEAVASLGTIFYLHEIPTMISQLYLNVQPITASNDPYLLNYLQAAVAAVLTSSQHFAFDYDVTVSP